MIESPEAILTPKLDSGERLLWSGRPRTGLRLRSQDAFLIPFSLLWGGFAIYWEYSVISGTQRVRHPAGITFPLFGVPFVIVGLHLIVGRFFVDAKMRAGITYGVTNERIIIVSGLFSKQLKSLQLRTLSDISLTEKSDGSGTITFGPTPFGRLFAGNPWQPSGSNSPPSFDMLERAKEVYEIIRRAQKATSANA